MSVLMYAIACCIKRDSYFSTNSVDPVKANSSPSQEQSQIERRGFHPFDKRSPNTRPISAIATKNKVKNLILL
jgi:hypothetical protein